MARKLRIEYPGAIYHVTNRGNHDEPIFKDDVDRNQFLATLGEACLKTNWKVHAYCLMLNHFHLVIETPQANLVLGMKWFLGIYTSRLNRRHKIAGHVFGGRYKTLIVDGGDGGYLHKVCNYVHLNPVRAKLLKKKQALKDFLWSSYPMYLRPPSKRVKWLQVERELAEVGIKRDDTAGRRRYAKVMEDRRLNSKPGEWKNIRRGWMLGSSAFKEWLLEQGGEGLSEHLSLEERVEIEEKKGERIIWEELRKLRWHEADLKIRLKTDAKKVRIALRLRRETVLTLDWVASRLEMGCRHTLVNCLKKVKNNALL